jgi:hypothetical protein
MATQRSPSRLFVPLFLVCLGALAPAWLSACDQIAAGQSLRIRLLQPVSSYSSKPGMAVEGILIESPLCDGEPVFPVGARVEGHITHVKKVGMGFLHEAASLEVTFERIVPEVGPSVDIQAHIAEVDNARETVRDGVVHGILSTNTVQSHVISLRLLQLPTWDPAAIWVLPLRRAIFPYSPEPEIYLPRGTDVRLELTSALSVAGVPPPGPTYPDFDEAQSADIDARINELPENAMTRKGKEGDVVNLAFVGTREQVENAFQSAGWNGSDSVSAGSVFREAHALFSLSNYPHLPISRQLLDGKFPDYERQKSFDSYAKRDHLRIWGMPDDWNGQPLWLSGTIHEVSADLSFSSRGGRFKFVHHLDSNLDEARDRVVRDLALAGCVESVHYVSRPAMTHFLKSPSGDDLHTDAMVAVVQLQNCHDPIFATSDADVPAYRPRSRFARYLRTQVLTFRSDLWRANAVYTSVELGRLAVHDVRRHRARELPPTIEVQTGGRPAGTKTFLP